MRKLTNFVKNPAGVDVTGTAGRVDGDDDLCVAGHWPVLFSLGDVPGGFIVDAFLIRDEHGISLFVLTLSVPAFSQQKATIAVGEIEY